MTTHNAWNEIKNSRNFHFFFSLGMEPIIKVRYKEKLLFLFLAFLSSVHSVPICDKTPVGQGTPQGGDNGFAIQLSGSPRKYRPNQVYTIKLSVSHIN